MPKVDGKKFPYTTKGKAAAKKYYRAADGSVVPTKSATRKIASRVGSEGPKKSSAKKRGK